MNRMFYQLIDDESIKGRWYLDEAVSKYNEINVWDLTAGRRLSEQIRLIIPIQHYGTPLDFTLAGFDVPVVVNKVASLFNSFDPNNIQIVHAEVGNDSDNYKVLNITRCLECVNQDISEFDLWTVNDGRPDKVGQYRTMYNLKIDESKIASDEHCFRVKHWEVALIVSDALKREIENQGVTGAKFVAV